MHVWSATVETAHPMLRFTIRAESAEHAADVARRYLTIAFTSLPAKTRVWVRAHSPGLRSPAIFEVHDTWLRILDRVEGDRALLRSPGSRTRTPSPFDRCEKESYQGMRCCLIKGHGPVMHVARSSSPPGTHILFRAGESTTYRLTRSKAVEILNDLGWRACR